MKSIHDIFDGEFAKARNAIVQRLEATDKNVNDCNSGFTEHWPQLQEPTDLIVLSFGQPGSTVRELCAGFITDVDPTGKDGKTVRIYVDRFRPVGVHDLALVSDAEFYANGGGGGSRVKVTNTRAGSASKRTKAMLPNLDIGANVPEGAMERRLVWVRKNHRKFRDPVWLHWEGKCAVSDDECAGLLIASHIYPWAKSSPVEKTDFNNGLLLSAPLDRLFDRGLISFSDNGEMLVKSHLSKKTREVFGIPKQRYAIARMNKITKTMRIYLKRHRQQYGFD